MKPLIHAGLITLGACLYLGSEAALAGLFDKFKEKAEAAIAEQKAEVEDASSQPTAAPGPGESPNNPASASGQTALATVNGTPTEAARAYLLIHYNPQVLDEDRWLKLLARRTYPSVRDWISSDEFRWRRERDTIRSALRNAAEEVPMRYDITPWPDAGPTVILGQYDFDSAAFGMSGVHWPWGRDNPVRSLSVPVDKAEQLAAAFGEQPRNLYGKYTLVVNGAELDNRDRHGRGDLWRSVIWDDRIDKIDFYIRKGFQGETPEDYEYALSLDTRQFRSENPTVGP